METSGGKTGGLRLIDAIGPFFRNYDKRRINWSKIPFHHLQTEGPGREAQWRGIAGDLEQFAARVKAEGFTAVTLDDVVHLVDHPYYEPEVGERIRVFAEEFRKLFEILREAGLGIYLTADYLATTPAIDARIGSDPGRRLTWFKGLLRRLFAGFPEIDGVILRIGECDGTDVKEPLRSRMALRRPREVRRMLETILPVFEANDRKLIFRTWTVGAYPVGDLIWHPRRIAGILRGIGSPALIVSMKPGDTDFFRHLPLNPLFRQVRLPKLIELQARREYEGAGEFPSFIGWQCERLREELRGVENVAGFSMWCQTGGWHPFRRLSFLSNRFGWTELNVAIAAKVMAGFPVEDAIRAVTGEAKADAAIDFFRLDDEVIRKLLYIEPFAIRAIFFRRVRIPPLLFVHWDVIFVNRWIRGVIRHFVTDREAAWRQGENAFAHFPEMIRLAGELGWPVEDIEFMRDTFGIVRMVRRLILLPECPERMEQLLAAKRAYKKRWPRSVRQRYRIKTAISGAAVRPGVFRGAVRLVLRDGSRYRTLRDHVFTLRVLPAGYRFCEARFPKAFPKFVRKSAMGIGSLFR